MPTYGYREQSDPPKFFRFLWNKKLALMIGSVIVAVLLITFSNKGLLRRVMLESELSDREEHIGQLTTEIDSLKRVRNKLLYDKATIERVAREVHGMIKPGEIVYRVHPAGAKSE